MTRLPNHRMRSAFAGVAMIIAATPALVVSQSVRSNDPWNNPWAEPWPALLDRPRADTELAALQRRIDAALERLVKSDGSFRGRTVVSLGSEADQRLGP